MRGSRPFIRISSSWLGFQLSSSVYLSHFSGGRYKMPKGETFVGILDYGAEEPKSRALRYVISGVALALLIAAGLWYVLRYTTEKHTVERFMNAVVAGDSQQAYQIWHAHPGFSYQDFISFWGPKGYYSPIKSYRM